MGAMNDRLRTFATRRTFVLVGAAAWLLAFAWTGFLPLDNDALYADVGRTMLRTGDWLNPRIHGVPFLDKPPLFYWMMAAVQSVFSDWIFTLRLPAILCAWATAVLAYNAARSRNPETVAGALAVLFLLGNTIWFEYARRAYMEVPVALFVFATTLALLRAWRSSRDGTGYIAWYAAAGLFTGVAFMLKSLVGLFAVIGFAAWLLIETRGRALANLRVWTGALVFLAVLMLVAAPWHLYQFETQRDVFMEFTWNLHVHDQIFNAQPWSTGPWYFYLDVWLRQLPIVGLVTLGGWLAFAFRGAKGLPTSSLDRLLAISGMAIFVILSASETKKDLYLIPLAPYAAVLLARVVAVTGSSAIRNVAIAVGVVALLMDTPAMVPGGSVLAGAEPVVAASRAARDASNENDTVYVVDLYFVAAQFYSERRAVSVWTRPGPAEVTGHIPYIRYGKNMIDVPLADLPDRMQLEQGVWIVPNPIADALIGRGAVELEKLHQDSMLSVVRVGATGD